MFVCSSMCLYVSVCTCMRVCLCLSLFVCVSLCVFQACELTPSHIETLQRHGLAFPVPTLEASRAWVSLLFGAQMSFLGKQHD